MSFLDAPVAAFVDDIGAALATLDTTDSKRRVALEACDIACAVIDADGRITDDEARALTATFGAQLDQRLVGATPQQVRASGLIDGKRRSLEQPSALFRQLLDADGRDGTTFASLYYQRAVDLVFATAAIDRDTSAEELDAIEQFRLGLLASMDDAGVQRPGQPTTAPGSPSSPGSAATSPPAGAVTAAAPEEPAEPLDVVLAELDALIGMDTVKREVHRTTDLARIDQLRTSRGLPTVERSRHLVFTGNPGTGKTTVARLLARIYRSLGIVKKGHLVESDRSQLVAGYVGQTAPLVRKAFDKADGGVLLIDEAYALLRGGSNDFGLEAIDTIVKLVEDRRDSVIVIVAGYPEEMEAFVDANPGLRSRFPTTILFPDYSDDELVAIFESLGTKPRYACDDDARAKVRAWFAAQPRTKGFGNGRLARNLFEAAVARQAERLTKVAVPTDEQLCTLTAADIPNEGEEP